MKTPRLRHACPTLVPILFAALLAGPAPAQERSALRSSSAPEMAPNTKEPAQVELPVELPLRPARQDFPDLVGGRSQRAKSDVPATARSAAALHARERVEYDDQGELGLWARGASYKTGFGRDGTIYAPFLGSRAPRCYPVTFRLAQASVAGAPIAFDAQAAPVREGDVVRYQRGGVTEIYELGLGAVEQRFVIESLPARGEIVLRISAETDLEGRELEERIEFGNELGAVRYGRATAIDASGSSIAAPTTWTASGIEIRVPGGFVENARFPLVIDPVVSTFSVDTTMVDSFFPDVACSQGVDTYYLSVYEETFSSSDHDVRYRLLNVNGASVTTGYIDGSLGNNWTNPAVAITGDPMGPRFLVVAAVGAAPSRTIQGRLLNRIGQITSSAFTISASDQIGDKLNPDVGGDPYNNGGAFFCVVWERVFSPTDRDIHYRLVSPQGALQGTATKLLDNTGGTVDTSPSISKSNDSGNWNVVWQRASVSLPVQQDIRAARVLWNGNITAASFAVDSSVTNTRRPSASTNLKSTERWVIAYERDFSTDTDIGLVALNGPIILDSVDLTGLEVLAGGLPTLLENQIGPDVDADSNSFAVAYAESYQGSSIDFDIYVSTVALTGDRLNLSEGHKNLAFSSTAEDHVAIASLQSSCSDCNIPVRHYIAVWDDLIDPAVHANIEGGFYDSPLFTSFCFPGQEGVAACPCGNPPGSYGRGCNNSSSTGGARIAASGTSALSNPDTLVLTSSSEGANVLSIFNQGNAVINAGAIFGQGVRCVGGSLKRLYTKSASGGSASAPTGSEPSVHVRSQQLGDPLSTGMTRAYYVYYRDPVVLGGCPMGSTFNATQSVQVLWVY